MCDGVDVHSPCALGPWSQHTPPLLRPLSEPASLTVHDRGTQPALASLLVDRHAVGVCSVPGMLETQQWTNRWMSWWVRDCRPAKRGRCDGWRKGRVLRRRVKCGWERRCHSRWLPSLVEGPRCVKTGGCWRGPSQKREKAHCLHRTVPTCRRCCLAQPRGRHGQSSRSAWASVRPGSQACAALKGACWFLH